MIETEALKKKKKKRKKGVSITKMAAVSDYRKYPLQAEKTDCDFLVSLTELQRSFLKTPLVLPTLTQNHAARRKEIKYAWLPGMKALVKIPSVKILCWPIFPLGGFYSKGTSPEAMTRLQGV